MAHTSFSGRNSPPHLALAAYLIKPRALKKLKAKTGWEAALGETIESAIARLDVVERAPQHEALDAACTVPELKALLKERKLKVSGRKEALIRRLLDENAAKTPWPEAFRCRTEFIAWVDGANMGAPVPRAWAEHEIRAAMNGHDWARVVRVYCAYRAQQQRPRVELAEGEIEAVRAPDESTLACIFSAWPRILKQVHPTEMPWLRFGAARQYLWSLGYQRSWFPMGFTNSSHLDNEVAARMLIFFAWDQSCRARIHRSSMPVIHAQNCCDICLKLNGARAWHEVPELPYEHCDSPAGCTCALGATTKRKWERRRAQQAREQA